LHGGGLKKRNLEKGGGIHLRTIGNVRGAQKAVINYEITGRPWDRCEGSGFRLSRKEDEGERIATVLQERHGWKVHGGDYKKDADSEPARNGEDEK